MTSERLEGRPDPGRQREAANPNASFPLCRHFNAQAQKASFPTFSWVCPVVNRAVIAVEPWPCSEVVTRQTFHASASTARSIALQGMIGAI